MILWICGKTSCAQGWSGGHPRYQNFATPSILSFPSTPSRLNYISPQLSAISTCLCHSLLYVALLHFSVFLWLKSLATSMCTRNWSQRGSGYGPSFMMATFNSQCRYMKSPLSLPGVFALAVQPSTGHSNDFKIRGNDTTMYSDYSVMFLYHVYKLSHR